MRVFKWLVSKVVDYFRIGRIINYMIKTGTSNTTSGNWYIYFDELLNLFPYATFDWIIRHEDLILKRLDRRKEILSETWIEYDEWGVPDSFSLNLCGNYCPYWEEEPIKPPWWNG